MPSWIYFIHAPRENFAKTMTAEEDQVWSEHFARGHSRGELRPFRVSLLRGRAAD